MVNKWFVNNFQNTIEATVSVAESQNPYMELFQLSKMYDLDSFKFS